MQQTQNLQESKRGLSQWSPDDTYVFKTKQKASPLSVNATVLARDATCTDGGVKTSPEMVVAVVIEVIHAANVVVLVGADKSTSLISHVTDDSVAMIATDMVELEKQTTVAATVTGARRETKFKI